MLRSLQLKNLKQIIERYLLKIYQMVRRNKLILIAPKIHSIEMILQQKNVMMTDNYRIKKKLHKKL